MGSPPPTLFLFFLLFLCNCHFSSSSLIFPPGSNTQTPLLYQGSESISLSSQGAPESSLVASSDPLQPLLTVQDNAVVSLSNLTLSTSSQSPLIVLKGNASLFLENVIFTGSSISGAGVIQIQNQEPELVTLSLSSFLLDPRGGLATIQVVSGRTQISLSTFSITSGEPLIFTNSSSATLSVTAQSGIVTSSTSYFLRVENAQGDFLFKDITFSQAKSTQLSWVGSGGTVSLQGVKFYDAEDASPLISLSSSLFTTVSVSSCEFTGNQVSLGSSSLFNLASSTITQALFESTTFSSNTVSGGLLSTSSNGTLLIQGSLFQSNAANQALNIAGATGTVLITSTEFSFNNGSSVSSAISMTNSQVNLTVAQGCTFTSNRASSGAAIFATSGSIDLSDSTFTGNVASRSLGGSLAGQGGALSFDQRLTAKIARCSFTSNQAESGGAISLSSAGSLSLQGSTFTTNVASLQGGALFVGPGNLPVQIDSCNFTSNSATSTTLGGGGAISFQTSAALSITTSTFLLNSGGYQGGTIFLQSSAQLTVGASSFSKNTGLYGAVFHLASTNISIWNSTFSSNNAAGRAGVFHLLNSASVTLTVNGSTFLKNSGGNDGGVLSLTGTSATSLTLTVSDSLFQENTALRGGAMGFKESPALTTVSVSSSRFRGNVASFEGGGAVSVTNLNFSITIRDTIFENNTAALEGGALYLSRGTYSYATLTGQLGPNVQFTSNSANTAGGLYISRLDSTNLMMGDLTFTSNIGKADAGGLMVQETTVPVTLRNFTFYYNKALGAPGLGMGGSLRVWSTKGLTIEDCVFQGNEAVFGSISSLYEIAGAVVIRNITSKSNKTFQRGSIYVARIPSVTLANINVLGSFGSQLFASEVLNVTIIDSAFSDLALVSSGPKVFFTFDSLFRGQAFLSSLSFTRCNAPTGSIFSMAGNGSVTISNTMFTSNTAPAIQTIESAAVVVQDCTFNQNSGASQVADPVAMLDVTQQSSLRVSRCSVTNNNFDALWRHRSSSTQGLVSEMSFQNNSFAAGAFISSLGTALFSNISFVPAVLSTQGPCFSLSAAGIIELRDSIIQGCNSVTNHALIDSKGSSVMRIINSLFSQVLSSLDAAAQLQDNSQLSISQSKIIDVNAKLFSVTGSGAKITLLDSDFSDVVGGANDGSFLYLDRGAIGNVCNCTFTNSQGSCMNIGSSTFQMLKTVFTNCQSPQEAGVVRFSGSPIASFREVIFSQNNSPRGGVIMFSSPQDASILFEDCEFSHNSATSGGVASALLPLGNNVTFLRSSFLHNSAVTFGGVFASSSSAAQISLVECLFENNTAQFGGIAHLDWETYMDFEKSTLRNNLANGEALFFMEKSSSLSFTDCEINGGGSPNGNGGLAQLSFWNQLALIRSNVTGLTARNGGVLASREISKVNVSIHDCIFTGNQASENGGALYLTLDSDQSLIMGTSSFIGNSAKNGGAIFLTNSDYPPQITEVHYSDNLATETQNTLSSPPKSLKASVANITHNSGDQLPEIRVDPLDVFGKAYTEEMTFPLVLLVTIKHLSNSTTGAYLSGNTQVTVKNGPALFSPADNPIKMFGASGAYQLVIAPIRSVALQDPSSLSVSIDVTIKECQNENNYFVMSDLSCQKAKCEGCLTERGAVCVAPGNCSCASAFYEKKPTEGLHCELIKDSYDSIKLTLNASDFPVTVTTRDDILETLNTAYKQNKRDTQDISVKFRSFVQEGETSIFKFSLLMNEVYIEGEDLEPYSVTAFNALNSSHSVDSSPQLEPSPAFYLTYSHPIVIVVLVVSVVMMAVTLIFGIIFFINGSTPVVRATSPLFCFLMLLGILLSYSTFFSYVGLPTRASCSTPVALFPLAFAIIFGNLFAKTFRIYRIFTNRKMRVVAPKSQVLLGYSGGLLAIELILIITWLAIAAPVPIKAGDEKARYWTCASPNSKVSTSITSILVAFNGAILVFGVYLAVQTRNAYSAFRESQLIGFVVYCLAVVGVVILPVLYSIDLDLATSFAIRSFAILFATSATLILLFGPKVYVILFQAEKNTQDYIENRRSSSSGSKMQVRKGKQTGALSQGHTGWVLLREKGFSTRWTKKYAVHYGDCIGFHDDDACITTAPISHWRVVKDGERLNLTLGKNEWQMETNAPEDLDKWHGVFQSSTSRVSSAMEHEHTLSLKEISPSQ